MICDIVVSIETKEERQTSYEFKKANYNGMKTFLEKYDGKRAFHDAEVTQHLTSSNLYITQQCHNLFLWQQARGRGNLNG